MLTYQNLKLEGQTQQILKHQYFIQKHVPHSFHNAFVTNVQLRRIHIC